MTSAILRHLAQQLKAGDPEWWKLTLKAWEHRKFVSWNEAWTLFLAAMHYEALSDADSPLVPYFPTCGGTDEADPSSGVAKFLRDAPDSFYDSLRRRHRRAYGAPVTALWPLLGAMYFLSRELPFYAVEAGAGAGLNLTTDDLIAKAGFPSDMVAARVGIDEKPLVIEDLNDRRWATACLYPDSRTRVASLDKAIDRTLERQRADPNFLQLVACLPDRTPAFLAKNIPSDDEEVGLLVFNMNFTSRMTDAEYRAYAQSMAGMMKPWGDRALWLEFEPVRGETFSTTLEVRAAKIVEGVPSQQVVLRSEAGSKMKFSEAAKFLYPKGAKTPLEDILKGLPA